MAYFLSGSVLHFTGLWSGWDVAGADLDASRAVVLGEKKGCAERRSPCEFALASRLNRDAGKVLLLGTAQCVAAQRPVDRQNMVARGGEVVAELHEVAAGGVGGIAA